MTTRAIVRVACCSLGICVMAGALQAAPTTVQQAENVVESWLHTHVNPLGAGLGREIENVQAFPEACGPPTYFVVALKPSGFVVVPADDLVEPVVAFVASGTFRPSQDNPLAALVINDISARLAEVAVAEASAARQRRAFAPEGRLLHARNKWERLLATRQQERGEISISEVWVSPLVNSEWSQATACDMACYNYYTPPGPDDSTDNYPSGCVATAMAQLMRFHEHPTEPVGTDSFTIYVDGSEESRSLRGGDGLGGAYNWSDMVLDPAGNCATLSEPERQAIGALCHDAAVSVGTYFWSYGSGAFTVYAADALESTFGYSNAVSGYNGGSDIGAGLNDMVNPNLDAGFPVLLGIKGDPGNHAVVCDGYGYDTGTLYHHLNLGLAGWNDAWYNLPTVDASFGTFTSVHQSVYNVFVTGSGEIISGRVTDQEGDSIEGAAVTAERDGGGTYADTTDVNGVYALAGVPSSSTFTVGVSKAGYAFLQQSASTGTSSDSQSTSGNEWGIDFVDRVDCNSNSIPDECDVDCGISGGPCDVSGCGLSQDCNSNGVPDECETLEAGDFNDDDVVDLVDYEAMVDCFAGPNAPPAPLHPGCVGTCLAAFDFDTDSDVDASDFAQFQVAFD